MRLGALILNPAAGRHRAARLRDRIVTALAARGWAVDAFPTEGPGQATEIARELARPGIVEAIFALGGDGTQREVAAGLLGSEVALAPLPGGTTNVLARALGIPSSPVAAATALSTAPRRPLAVGRCGETPFLMMVSAGFDAAVMAALDARWKAKLGIGAVGAQGIGTLWSYPFPPVEARWDGQAVHGSFIAACNIPLYAGPFAMVPGARSDDDRLDVVMLKSSGRLSTLSFVSDLVRGRHLSRRDVVTASVGELELSGPAGLPLQVDGDRCLETLPARVRVDPQRLQVLAPAS